MRRSSPHNSRAQPSINETAPKSQLRRVHLSLLYGLSLGLITLLIFSVSQTLQERLSNHQARQQIQAWKDYAKALKVVPQPKTERAPDSEQACPGNCKALASSGVLNVESPEPDATGPSYHF
jgi:hypothetical protein